MPTQDAEAILQALGLAARSILRSDAGEWLADPSLDQLRHALGADRMCLLQYQVAGDDRSPTSLAYAWPAGAGALAEGAAAPVYSGESHWGRLTIASADRRSWSGAQIAALQSAAEMMGAAIHHRQSHEDLRVARERLQCVVGSSPVAMFTSDPRRNFATTWISENVAGLFGIPAGWFMDEPLLSWDFVHPDDREAIAAGTGNLSFDRPYVGQYRYRHPSGEIRWIRVEMRLIAGASGAPAEAVGCLIDTTETMQALKNLQRREAILNAVSFVAERFLYGEEWEDAIPAALERLGKAAGADQVLLIQRVLGAGGAPKVKLRHAWTAGGNPCSNSVFPAGTETGPVAAVEPWEQALDRGEMVAGCVSSLPPAERAVLEPEGVQSIAIIPIFLGSTRWGQIGFSRGLDVAWPAATLEGLRVAAGIIGAAIQQRRARHTLRRAQQDLERRVGERTLELALASRALQESEQLYRTLVETCPDGILVSDPGHRITMVNPRAVELFGWEGAEEPIGTVNRELIKGDRLQATELTLQRRDGSTFKADVSASVVRDAAGEPRYIIRIVRDITARKQLEEQFRQAQKMEAVGRLAGGIAHDFNNLLTVMTGYGELLLKRLSADAVSSRKVAQIVKAAERAAALVEHLLAFSRKQMVEPKIINVNAAIEEMEKMLRRLIGEDIEFSTRLDAEAGRVRVDPAQIDQLLMNLTVNARDAMQSGGTVTISTQSIQVGPGADPPCPGMPAGRFVAIEVRDTGTGISEEDRPHIFEPFFTTKEIGKGTGLGLSTVYGIVQQTGGFIGLESAPGAGSAFRIYLPSVNGHSATAPAQMPEPRNSGGRETILVTEDEDAVRAMIVETLEECGYSVLEARHGRHALDVAAQCGGAIDLLLTDVVMPQMGGPELWKTLAPLFPAMRLLYITGYADRDLEAGAPFLKKPFSPDALSIRVRETLDAAARLTC